MSHATNVNTIQLQMVTDILTEELAFYKELSRIGDSCG